MAGSLVFWENNRCVYLGTLSVYVSRDDGGRFGDVAMWSGVGWMTFVYMVVCGRSYCGFCCDGGAGFAQEVG